jgi:hypothetical protein
VLSDQSRPSGHSVGSAADQYPRQQFRLSVRIAAGLLIFAAVVACLEIGLRIALSAPDAELVRVKADLYRRLYTPEELRTSDPSLPRRVNPCVHPGLPGLNWDPRFGFAAKRLDKACARELFKSAATSVVLFGGSAMNSSGAPNHLTTIDHYAFGDDQSVVSINLAESAARLSNMSARFLHEVIELRPKVAVFLVGLNEFNSIRFGGPPGDDFFWTAGVSRRVHHPMMFLLDKAVEKSRLAQVLLIQTGIYPSARQPSKHVDMKMVDMDVDYYFRTQEQTAILCKSYSIRCIFILQPTPLARDHLNDRERLLVQAHSKIYPEDAKMIARGYRLLRAGRGGNRVLDPSALFDGVADANFDPNHFTKIGNAILGKYIRDVALEREP